MTRRPIADDYVDVAERIREFKERFPEGSLQSVRAPELVTAGEKTFVVYAAAAYRTPDDPRPGIGWAWEPVPGPTPFTRDSELMNAETSAWGRAIVALGFETKKIASAEEVRNRAVTGSESVSHGQNAAAGSDESKARFAANLKALKEAYPEQDWDLVAKTYMETTFNKTSSSQLTPGEWERFGAYIASKLTAPDDIEFAPDLPKAAA